MELLPRLALLLQTVIAAGTFLVAKDATSHFHPLRLVWFRIVLSAVLIGLANLALRRRLPAFTRREWLQLALLGILGTTVNQGLFLYGIEKSTPLHASLLYAFTPVMVLGAAAVWLGEKLTWLRSGGVALAVVGVALVLTARGLDLGGGPLLGDLYILVAVAAWAAFTILGKDILRRHGALAVITASFLMGALSILPAAPWVLGDMDWSAPGLRGWGAVIYLSALTSGVAFTLWYWALKRLEASQVAVFTNLQAPLTALLAWWLMADVPALQALVGGGLVLAGVTLAQLSGRRRAAVRETPDAA